MELLSKGIYLEICEDETVSISSKFKRLYGLSSVPDIGGDAEKVDVTNLSDENRRYIPGIIDYGDLEFGFSTMQMIQHQKPTFSIAIPNCGGSRKPESTFGTAWFIRITPDISGKAVSMLNAVQQKSTPRFHLLLRPR